MNLVINTVTSSKLKAAIIFLLLCTVQCKAQPHVELAIPQAYFKPSKYNVLTVISNAGAAYDITNAMPAGFDKRGETDYTNIIQTALDHNKVVIFPDCPVLINEKGLTVHSNSTLIFRPNSKLKLKTNSLAYYEVLRIHNDDNVNVYFPVITGDKLTHTGTEGQWGMGISIKSSRNVKIIDAKISNCWGDGIYIGQINFVPSQDITIEHPFLDRNRRNGISVTNVNGLKIMDGLISNTNGQSPQCGIDVEPNTSKDVIDNISIINLTTFNNFKYGIVISLNNLASQDRKNVNIDIENHVDDSSAGGLAINRYKGFLYAPFTGNITVNNAVWRNSRKEPFYYNRQKLGVKINFNNLDIQSKTNNGTYFKDALKLNKVKAKLLDVN